jgi:hypothetical protein
MEQKIPPEILQRQELTLIGQVEMHLTLAYGGPCIPLNRVYASLIHRLRPHDNHASNGDSVRLVKIDRFSNVGWKPVLRLE